MGVSIAAVGAIGPVFIVGAGLSRGLQAKRLTTYNLVAPAGQVLGGAMMAAAAAAGWTYSQRFWLAAAVMMVAAALTWFSSAKPADRIEHSGGPVKNSDRGEEKEAVKATAREVIISTFGLYILILVLISITSNGINNQISNILPNLYGIDAKTTAALISLAGLLNLGFFIAAGLWMARSGAMTVFTAGTVARLAGALSMALLGLMADAPLLLVAAGMMLLYQGTPFVRMAQPVLAVRFAPLPAGEANGWVLGASAIGSFIGSVLGGWLADAVGFNAINWMAAITAGLAFALIILFLWPANRRMRSREAEKEAVSVST
jgi:predicted MFS family arabinose efflux permease